MRKTWELLLKEAVIVAFCAIAGVIALAITYFIPQGDMWDNVHESSIILYNEGLGAHIWQNIEETMLDGYTDGLLLNVSYTETKDGIRDILLDTYVEVDGRNPMASFYEVTALANDDYIVRNYGRYWHGYQILLRPLLCFFTYSDIRQINMILQLALVFLLVSILAGSKDRIFIIPFGGMYLLLSPISLFSSLQFSPCFYIMMLALIVIFACKDVLNDTRRNYLFLLTGILTAYFDLLTYPFITLGVPLLACLGSAHRRSADDRMGGWKHVFLHTVSWCLGYVGMWSAKWVVTTILTGENIIYDAFVKIKYRSGYFSVRHSYFTWRELGISVYGIFMIGVIRIRQFRESFSA